MVYVFERENVQTVSVDRIYAKDLSWFCNLQDLFTEVSSKLEETQEKLDTTKTTLSCTQKLLHDTAQKLDEQK